MRPNITPPNELVQYVGGGDFHKVGEEFFRYFIQLAKLKSTESVLDVGCGCGRMAVPLINYLAKTGNYNGFDIHASGIKWCQDNISVHYKNFRFEHVNIFHQFYNPSGIVQASQYKFPYPDKSFDFIFLTSVFTHLKLLDIQNYLAEIKRVLKVDGRILLTFFLLTQESKELINAQKSSLPFIYDLEDGCYTIDFNHPEIAIAYDEEVVRDLLNRFDLQLTQPIRPGSWCGRKHFLSYQDILIMKKVI